MKIFILTGTRADWGKVQYLIERFSLSGAIKVEVVVSGMHLSRAFGSTYMEIIKKFPQLKKHYVSNLIDDSIASDKTYKLYEELILSERPDYVFVHGDRLEPLIMATVCCVNSVPTFHMEGGENSGTQDEMFRHAISKLSSFHLPANDIAARKLLSLGEDPDRVLAIGSLDIQYAAEERLPTFDELCKRYELNFNTYIVVSFHPVTTDEKETRVLSELIKKLPSILAEYNLIVIQPNNDKYYKYIYDACVSIKHKDNVRVFSSMRFEYYLCLLKNTQVLIGNSSAGIREMPALGKPTINIGTRQNNRDAFGLPSIHQIDLPKMNELRELVTEISGRTFVRSFDFTVSDVEGKLIELEAILHSRNIKVQK